MAPVKGVLFDADGVVQLPPATWRASLESLCGEPARADEFLADVFAAEKPCLHGAADFRSSLAAVLGAWNSMTSVEEALRVWTQIEPDREMLDVVASLRSAHTVVGLATNQQAYRADFMTRGLGYSRRFDHLLYSCELGHSKPSAAYFTAALAKVGIEPGEALFIDDHESNVSAARACGLNAEVFHVSEGVDRIHGILRDYGIRVA